MLDDSSGIADGATLRTPVCIIGGGAAGLTIARALRDARVGSIVLEAGGTHPTRKSQAAYWARQTGAPNHSFTHSRFRSLGGSTTYWSRQCVELEAEDFEGRDSAAPAWPFRKADLASYYERASRMLHLRTAGEVVDSLQPASVFDPGDARFSEARLSAIGNFTEVVLPTQADNGILRILVNAAVTEFRLDDHRRSIESVVVRLPGDRIIRCEAQHFVLAAGGIENARLLLASNRQVSCGLGNEHDLVGRFFMDHAYMFAGTIHHAPARLNSLIMRDPSRQRENFGGFVTMTMRVLTPAGQSNAAALFLKSRPSFAFEEEMYTEQGVALTQLGQIARKQRFASRDTKGHILALCTRPDRTAKLVASRFRSVFRPREVIAVRLFAETTPDRESRVRLLQSCDALGIPQAEVNWRVPESDKIGPSHLIMQLKESMCQIGADFRPAANIGPGQPWPASFSGGKHHMGTTRMHNASSQGVVDSDCRLHGIANLHVAGSSVFPTSGWANPTFTIVALALRLSDRIVGIVKRGAD